MANAYEVMGLATHAEDADIRKRYLELIVQFPPEQHPETFTAVRAAYEKIRTLEARARYRLFQLGKEDTLEAVIEEVECTMPRPSPSLDQLLKSIEPPKPNTAS